MNGILDRLPKQRRQLPIYSILAGVDRGTVGILLHGSFVGRWKRWIMYTFYALCLFCFIGRRGGMGVVSPWFVASYR